MNYDLVLKTNIKKSEKFFEVVKSEEDKKNRSEISVSTDKDKVNFHISATDATALKSSINRIIKTLSIYEKTLELVKNG